VKLIGKWVGREGGGGDQSKQAIEVGRELEIVSDSFVGKLVLKARATGERAGK
jgi:hypothetical protein